MTKYLLTLLFLGSSFLNLIAQSTLQLPAKKLEYQIGYFGEFFAHPGVKVGAAYPFAQKLKTKEKQKRKYTLTKTRIRQLKVGTNLAFYNQVNNHNGYLWNIELTYQRIKNKSKKPNKLKYFDASIGLGYFHYELLGETFQSTENDFEEINGNGNAFMPTLAFAWGRNLQFVKSMDMRYYIKPTFMFERPVGIGTHPRFALEIGLASTLR